MVSPMHRGRAAGHAVITALLATLLGTVAFTSAIRRTMPFAAAVGEAPSRAGGSPNQAAGYRGAES